MKAATASPQVMQVTSVHGVLAQDPETLSYDADGNLTADGLWDYTYDAENRLIKMQTNSVALTAGLPGQRLVFRYDSLGRRTGKELWTYGSSIWTQTKDIRFIYQGWNLIAELSLVSGPLSLVRSYAWGLDVAGSLSAMGGVGALLQITDYSSGTSSYLPGYDGSGNVAVLIKNDGSLSATYEYSPFGESLRKEGTYAKENPFRFSTKYTDDASGLVYYGHRYYSPSLGRFLNQDPGGVQGGVNLYAFVSNSPVNAWDYLGLAQSSTVCTAVPGNGGWWVTCWTTYYDDGTGSLGQQGVDPHPYESSGGGGSTSSSGQTSGNNPTDKKKNKDPCQSLNDALTAAQNVRGGKTGKGAPGWVKGQTLVNPRTGYNSTIFTNPKTGAAMLVFPGTDPLSGNDWAEDINQRFGRSSPQYDQAVTAALEAKRTYGDKLSIAGHSLGGGEGSLAGLVTGVPTYTFNASGLSSATMGRYGVSADQAGNIQAYHVRGEILSVLRSDSIENPVVGKPIELDPYSSVLDNYLEMTHPGVQSVRLHGIDRVIRSLKKAIAAKCGGK